MIRESNKKIVEFDCIMDEAYLNFDESTGHSVINCKDTEEMNIQDTIQDLISELLKKGFRLCYKDDYVYPEKFYLEIELD